jgi:hypothetical protein
MRGNDCRDTARGKIRGGEARTRAAERGRRRFWKEGLTGGPRTRVESLAVSHSGRAGAG